MASHVVGCQDMIIQGIIKPFFSHTIFWGEPFPKPSSHVLPSLVSTGMAPKKAPAQEVRTMATSFASKAMKTMKATNDHKKTMKASKDHNKTMKAIKDYKKTMKATKDHKMTMKAIKTSAIMKTKVMKFTKKPATAKTKDQSKVARLQDSPSQAIVASHYQAMMASHHCCKDQCNFYW